VLSVPGIQGKLWPVPICRPHPAGAEGLERIAAPVFVLSASAVNSAVLLLRSACDKARKGVANSAGLVGRNYMAHNNTALMSIGWDINSTMFQKTICINDFYFGDEGFKYPMGNIQGLGKLQTGMLSGLGCERKIPSVAVYCKNRLSTR
jgi:choline dehydrogenase-like flavoprotein